MNIKVELVKEISCLNYETQAAVVKEILKQWSTAQLVNVLIGLEAQETIVPTSEVVVAPEHLKPPVVMKTTEAPTLSMTVLKVLEQSKPAWLTLEQLAGEILKQGDWKFNSVVKVLHTLEYSKKILVTRRKHPFRVYYGALGISPMETPRFKESRTFLVQRIVLETLEKANRWMDLRELFLIPELKDLTRSTVLGIMRGLFLSAKVQRGIRGSGRNVSSQSYIYASMNHMGSPPKGCFRVPLETESPFGRGY